MKEIRYELCVPYAIGETIKFNPFAFKHEPLTCTIKGFNIRKRKVVVLLFCTGWKDYKGDKLKDFTQHIEIKEFVKMLQEQGL